MTSFAPACTPTSTVVRRFSRYLLMVPLCMLLIGCDSALSSDNEEARIEVAPADALPDADLQNLAGNFQDNSGLQSNPDSELDTIAEGQSLIAAAQSTNDLHTRQSLLNSESPSSSALQATLMGDYGGMVPCKSCDNIDVTLNLFADGSVLKTNIYNQPEKPQAPLVESGIYRQDNNTITIVYEAKNIETYHIQDNHLILMDEHKNPDNDYILARK
ncbi:copper resistance protein NlpE N-terminal domain-containing protein [Psychrobacter vallis]|uniref:copper resistance protein NlpE N-terminal domain-containing protein n=1 Tax=Psychrobacter vallis TaxID=248451 RepID=UPI001918E5C2|nr:copper resistance protein NlpE N-terminal domain-containing protein [Psychrobacter vallis]